MDLHGRVIAHPLFQQHSKGLIYELQKDLTDAQRKKAFRKFFEAQEIYPSLRLVG